MRLFRRRPAAVEKKALVFPDFTSANPFTCMLYADAPNRGISVTHLDPLADSLMDQLSERGTGTVLHLNWETALLHAATDADAAEAEVARVERALRAFRRRGGRIAWTIHNARPHEDRFPIATDSLVSMLAEEADLAHIMCPSTFEAVPILKSRPTESVAVIRHPAYGGWYPEPVDRLEARERLGISPEACVLGCIGLVRPYKGTAEALDALDAVCDVAGQRPVTLLVAGEVPPWDGSRDLLARMHGDHRVHLIARFLDDAEMRDAFCCCDVAVFPYKAILNSGSVLAALSFGVPVVAPRQGCVPDAVDEQCAVLFAPGDDDDLPRALVEAVGPAGLLSDAARQAALARAAQSPFTDISRDFLDALEPLWAPAGRGAP